MKKWFMALGAVLLLLFGTAAAEISTNLQTIVTTTTKNKVATLTYVDSEGNPVMAEDLGYARMVNSYQTHTLLSRTEYFDTEGNPVNNKWGFSVRKLTYTMRNIAVEEFFDKDGNLVTGNDGYARMESDWIQGKLHLETRYYDTRGNLTTAKSMKYARRVTEYITGPYRMSSDTFYDTEGNQVNGPQGYARVEYEYLGKSKTATRTAYLDAEGNLFYNSRVGYAVYEREHKGSVITADAYYGADGKLCPGPKGYARVELYYGNESKPVSETYFDENGNPYRMPGGYYALKRKYAPRGRIGEESYYDAEGNP